MYEVKQGLGWVTAVATIGAATIPGVVDVFTGSSKKEGEAEAYKQMLAQQQALQAQKAQQQDWILPLAIGGGVLVLAVVMLGGKRGG